MSQAQALRLHKAAANRESQRNPGKAPSPQRRREIAAAILRDVLAYEKQAAVAQAIHGEHGGGLVAVDGTRRSTKTTTIGLVTLALMIARDNFVVRSLATTLHAMTENWVDRDGDPFSLLGVLEDHGLRDVVKIRWTSDAIKEVLFPWGSVFRIHDLDNMRALARKRGFTADVYWIDEAQSMALLAAITKKLITPTRGDKQAVVVFSGTPGDEIGSFFHRVLHDDPEWLAIHMRLWDNPSYGKTTEERWTYFVEQVIRPGRVMYGLSDADIERIEALDLAEREAIATSTEELELTEWVRQLDPDLLRECFGRWVVGGAERVYLFHRVEPEVLYWAAGSERDIPRGCVIPVLSTIAERVASLPRNQRRVGERIYEIDHDWRAIMGLDIGVIDPSAWVIWAWAPSHPVAYELWSEKQPGLDDDEIWARTVALCDELRRTGRVQVQAVYGDFSGPRKGSRGVLDRRLQARLPNTIQVLEPQKNGSTWNKDVRIHTFNLDLKAGRIRVIAGGELDIEGQHLRYKAGDPDKPTRRVIDENRQVVLADGRIVRPRDDCLDAGLYGAQGVYCLFAADPEQARKDAEQASQVPAALRRMQEHDERALTRAKPRR